MISPPCVAMRSETLAVSILEPPPTATNPSKSPSTAKSAAAWKESSVGSTRERSHTSTSMPSASINSTTRPVMSAFTTPGSETSITRPTPIRFSSQPASSEAPGPYFRGVASMVKMVSLSDLESLGMMSFLSPREVLDPCTHFFRHIHVQSGYDSDLWDQGTRAMSPNTRRWSSPFAVDHVAYKLPRRYAERQMCPATADFKIFVTRLAIRWLHTVEAEKPTQTCGRPERVQPMAEAATSLTRWPVFRRRSEHRKAGRASVENRRIRQKKRGAISLLQRSCFV